MDHLSRQLHTISACSGGGGLDLAVELVLGCTRCICWIEWEAFAVEILAARMEAKLLAPAPVWSDLRTFDGKPWRGLVDIFTAGYPCQPFSLAGKRRGADDPRHLWPHVRRIAEEFEPPICFFENVSGHLSLGFDQVTSDLEALGYKVAAGIFTAAEVGALHKRERVFILAANQRADTKCSGWQGRRTPSEEPWTWEQFERLVQTDLRLSVPAGTSGGVSDGMAHRISKLRMLGNGVVPLQAAYAFCSLWSSLTSRAA